MIDSKPFGQQQNFERNGSESTQCMSVSSMEKSALHIAMFTNNYLPFIGGVSLAIDRLASELRRQGHRVFIFAPEYPINNNKDHEDTIRCKLLKYIKVHQLNYAISNIYSSNIEEIFEKLDIDVVHVHHPYWMGKKGIKIARKYKIPVVYTYHTRLDKYIKSIPYIGEKIGNWFPNYIIKHFSSNCCYIFAPTQSAKECLGKLNITTAIEVMPTGIDLDCYHIEYEEIEEIRKKYLNVSDILLFCASRLSKEKNLLFLLEGLKYVKNHTTIKFTCIIAGDGPEKRKMEKYLLKNKLTDNVHLLGTIPSEEINKYYRASDIFIFSSTSETQGLVLLEAMAASLPVVAVSGPGVDDMIQNGINGFKTNEDVREWGEKVIHLMENTINLKKMSIEAFETAKKYTMDTMGKKAMAVYKQIIANKRN